MKPTAVLVAVWLALSALHLGVSLRSDPGVYFDEVIQANPARDYLRGYARTTSPPQVTSIDLLGRPFPWTTQAYMGALKSQLLIPVFAVAGATPDVLRATTTVWGLLAIGVAMAFARILFGLGAACLLGALLAFDPTWLFVARHDWGSVSLALGFRMGALWLAVRAWQEASPKLAAAAGLAAGLAFFNKIDAAPFLAAAGAGLLAARPDVVRSLLLERRAWLAWGAGGFVLGCLPLLLSLSSIFAAAGSLSTASGFATKLEVALGTLDGSYFYRLIAAHGSFAEMFDVASPRWGLPVASLLGAAVLAPAALRRGGEGAASRFALVAWLVTQAGLFAMPAADRVHHALNVHPLPHLAAVGGLALLWRRCASPSAFHRAGRVAVAAAAAALLLSGAFVIDRTAELIERSGGRGLWSDASGALVRELDRPETRFVCLDWGFHQTLAFQTDEAKILDPAWNLRAARQSKRLWKARGGPASVYLIHPPRTDVFRFSGPFREAIAALDPERVEVRVWRDREGEPAFESVRILAPHELRYDQGFEVRLR